MSFIIAEAEDVVANPLDLVEQIVIANEWPFDRQTEDEMAVEITGKFCDFRLWFAWRPETAALHLSCALDMKVPAGRRANIYPLLAQLNERLWLGHFDLWTEESVPLFRHTLLVRGGPRPEAPRTSASQGRVELFPSPAQQGVAGMETPGVGCR